MTIFQFGFIDGYEENLNIWGLEPGEILPNPLYMRLPNNEVFNDKGLFAAGADLTASTLISAYRLGIFPWFSFRYEDFPLWYCPEDRFVIFPEEIHVSHSMKNLFNKGVYRCTFNQKFNEVIENCSKVDGRFEDDYAWLGDDIITSFRHLNRLGHAKSVEVWHGNSLVGGLYGMMINGCFMGESMFSLEPSASKYALIWLADKLKNQGKFIDCQFETPLFKSMGGKYITYSHYMDILVR